MAENLEPYHVPQQSRRDKLRILSLSQNPSLEQTHNNFEQHPHSQFSGLIPLYDPSLLTSDLLTCAADNTHLHVLKPNPTREEDEAHVKNNSFMGFVGGIVNASSSSSSSYADRAFDQHFNGETLVFKPEPLSLSLSSHHHNHQSNNLSRFGGYEVISGVFSGGFDGGGSALARSSVPLGPFTGYASILKGSKFLKPAQHLLEEFCNVGSVIYAERIDVEGSLLSFDPAVESLTASSGMMDGGGENMGKKSKLISLLDEVYRKYKQYYQQLQAVVASFECIPGLGNAAPYASLALKALSKHFKCLKNAITDQLQFTNKSHTHAITPDKVQCHRLGDTDARPLRPGFSEHHPPIWRPQRGLPERAVAVLRAWLFDHFLHPYPTDTDKLMLAKKTGLSRNQVSNWFINARVRLWKPMVEEIHMLETGEAQKVGFQRDDHHRNVNRSNDNLPSTISLASENPTSSAQRVHDTPSKRTRNDLPNDFNDPTNLTYNGHQQPLDVGTSVPGLSTNGVSLTLGLHQNNGIGLSEAYPINAAQRFGLGGGGYVMGGSFEGQNRQFGRDVLGGHLLHDFVG